MDSYGATSFAPAIPPPQPIQHLSVKNPVTNEATLGATMAVGSSPVPPTMMSGGPGSPQPHYVVTPAAGSPQPPQTPQQPAYLATMQSHAPMQQVSPSNSAMPYGPAPTPYGYGYPAPQYPMAPGMAPMSQQQQGTPGLAVASLICGLLGLVPFWIGFILCLLAIVFGGIVLSQTRPGQQGRGLAITGLVFGLVFVLPAACGL